MSNWYVYIALDKSEFITGICNDLINEEILLKEESSNNSLIIGWHLEFENKIDALKQLKKINDLSNEEKHLLVDTFKKIIIFKDEDYKENYQKFPLVYNLKQTLQISNYLKEDAEIWKLDDPYIEDVSNYLSVKKTQIEFIKLWNIAVDFSSNVGLVTKFKFLPIIKY